MLHLSFQLIIAFIDLYTRCKIEALEEDKGELEDPVEIEAEGDEEKSDSEDTEEEA